MKKVLLIFFFFLIALPTAALAVPTSWEDIPLAGQYLISASIGEDQPRFHARQKGDGLILTNQEQEFAAQVSDQGVTIDKQAASIGLNLTAYGYDSELSEADNAILHVEKNKVELRRGPVTEWYVNGPFGLQQGFTLHRRPAGSAGNATGELHLRLALKGVNATVSDAGNSLNLYAPAGNLLLQYTGLTAFDATGRELAARMTTENGMIHIFVHDQAARYPVVVDPLFQKGKLTLDSEGNDETELHLGYSVAANSSTLVVGAPGFHRDGFADAGAVYVYIKPETGWADMSQSARLLAANGDADDLFGRSVAIDSNDSLIVVGAPGYDSNRGRAYLFLKPRNVIGGNRWLNGNEDAILTNHAGTSAPFDQFGRSVAINDSTDAIVVGAPGHSSYRGTAYVFVRPPFPDFWEDQNSYEPTSDLLPLPGTGTYEFGYSVAIDSDRVVVGAPGDNSGRGAAFYYAKPGAGWSGNKYFNLKLVAGDGANNDDLGKGVAVSDNTIAAGAPYHGTSGAVFLFDTSGIYIAGSTLTHTTKLLPASVVDDAIFGHTLAVNDAAVVVGTPFQAVDGQLAQGAIHLFFKPGTGWPGTMISPQEMTEDVSLTAGDGAASDQFGWAVAINDDNTLLAGSWEHDTNGETDQGAAYVFLENSSSAAAKLFARQNLTGDRLGASVAVSGDTVVVGVPKHDTHGIADSGAAYVFLKGQGAWGDMAPAALLFAGDGTQFDNFGHSVAVSRDTVVVGAPYQTIGANLSQGAAYVFAKPESGWQGEITHTARLSSASGGGSDYFGDSVAVDGDTIVVGVPNENHEGGVHLFVKPAGQSWTDQSSPTAQLTSSTIGSNDRFGDSVAVSGSTVVASSPNHDVNGNGNQGAVYVFVEPAGGWGTIWNSIDQTAELTVSDGSIGDGLGTSVAIQGDILVAGAPQVSGNSGAAYVFHRPGAGWADMTTPTATLLPSDSATDQHFGISLGIGPDTIVCGAYGDSGQQGAAYLFRKSGDVWIDSQETEKLIADDGQPMDWLGGAVATDGVTAIAGASGAEIGITDKQGAAYVFDVLKIFPWAKFLPAFTGTNR